MTTAPAPHPPDDAVRRILEQRAAALARPPDADRGPATTPLLLLAVGDARVGLDASRVREVLPPAQIARLPGDGPLLGARNVRGEILAVADTAQVLSLTSTTAAADKWVVVLFHGTAPLGLLVDAALGLTDARVADLVDPGGGGTNGLVSAVMPDGVLLLDADALLDDPRMFTAPRPDPEEAD